MYILIPSLCMFLYLGYRYKSIILYNFLKIDVFINDNLDKIKLYFSKKKTYYDLENLKEFDTFQNKRMILKINHNDITKYQIINKDISINYDLLKKERMFTSVILYIDDYNFDCTSISNEFIFNETDNNLNKVLKFNDELALIFLFLKGIDYKINNKTKIKWGVITKNIEMFENNVILFKIINNELIEYKE